MAIESLLGASWTGSRSAFKYARNPSRLKSGQETSGKQYGLDVMDRP